ncbi:hypothetical protein RAN53_13075 [Halomonas sp. SSL-5]|uniref:DUF7281 domain-containing protein n=1 Tax=Halomonas sp. SSL-5 TaxID=3065855 RepID=UPI002739CA64|nr:hypothetical protein [Halomonas sp. SSL-5]MDY7117280.1 hypothetical protein [Halomonas sp. SSL-5]
MHLTTSARRLLRDAAERLRREPRVEKPRRKVVDEIVAWLDEQHIDPGPRLSRDWLRVDRDLLAQIDQALALTGEAPVAVDLAGMSSLEQARHGNPEEKGNREKPREYRVLASLPAGAPRPGIAQGARELLDLDRRRLDLAAFDVLVQVENLDSFYALPGELAALASWARPLILYRGDRHYGGGFADLARDWASSGKPHLYLGDFDARGVGLALESGATHLLLPGREAVAAHANAQHLPPEQLRFQAALRRHAAGLPEGHPLVGYLAILLGEQRGLRQQWFGSSTGLTPVPLPARSTPSSP